jgi:hypothetical protein
MPKESGYFEETTQFYGDEDLFVSDTAERLYRQMRLQQRDSGTVPLPGFNIFYFMQSTIRAWLRCDPMLHLSSKSFPYPCEPIKAVNWPDRAPDQASGVTSPLVARYLELVAEDSDPAGDDFDVTYAVQTLMATLNAEGLPTTAQEWWAQPMAELEPELEAWSEEW